MGDGSMCSLEIAPESFGVSCVKLASIKFCGQPIFYMPLGVSIWDWDSRVIHIRGCGLNYGSLYLSLCPKKQQLRNIGNP